MAELEAVGAAESAVASRIVVVIGVESDDCAEMVPYAMVSAKRAEMECTIMSGQPMNRRKDEQRAGQ